MVQAVFIFWTLIMKISSLFRSLALCAALILPSAPVRAAMTDYSLELLPTALSVRTGAIVTLRLTDLRSGSPVDGAVIFATRMDMAPDGMATMTAPVTLLPGEEPGHYRFQTDFVMAGNWQLSVAAKVQGEVETVAAQIVITVQP
jgi:hypothetical protein